MPVVFHPKMMLANSQREGLAQAAAVAHRDNDFVPICEILQVKRDVSRLQIATAVQFVRYVLGNVFRQRSVVLKATTRIGLLYWPVSRS
jgi:hypothetical protein